MKKLFVAVAAVMVVSATAFSTNNKMTNNGVDEPDTVVVDSSKAFALVDDTVTSDTVITDTEKFALAKNDAKVEPDTTTTEKEKVEEVIEKVENKIGFMA